MHHRTATSALLAAALAVLLMGAGCGRSSPPPAQEPAASTPVAVAPALPDEFPKDLPVLDGMRFVRHQLKNGKIREAMFSVSGTPKEWEQRYRAALAQAEWKVGAGLQQANGAIFDAQRSGRDLITVVIAPDPAGGGRVIMNIIFGPDPFGKG